MIVVDAGVIAEAIAVSGDRGDRARTAIEAAGAVSIPDCADVEVLHVLRKLWIRGRIDDDRFDQSVTDLCDAPFTRHPAQPLIRRAGQLRQNVSEYDAIYVALAEALDCTLLTIDGRLGSAPGPRCDIQLLG